LTSTCLTTSLPSIACDPWRTSSQLQNRKRSNHSKKSTSLITYPWSSCRPTATFVALRLTDRSFIGKHRRTPFVSTEGSSHPRSPRRIIQQRRRTISSSRRIGRISSRYSSSSSLSNTHSSISMADIISNSRRLQMAATDPVVYHRSRTNSSHITTATPSQLQRVLLPRRHQPRTSLHHPFRRLWRSYKVLISSIRHKRSRQRHQWHLSRPVRTRPPRPSPISTRVS